MLDTYLRRLLFSCGISVLFSVAFVLHAQANSTIAEKTHNDRKAKFSLRYPGDWVEKVDNGDVALSVASPDGRANVQIRTVTVRGNTTACDVLTQLEGAGQEAKKNVIPDDKRKPRNEELTAAGVADGCIGAYRLMQGEIEMLQGVGVYVKGRNAWILTQNLQAAARDQHAKSISDIARSFAAR